MWWGVDDNPRIGGRWYLRLVTAEVTEVIGSDTASAEAVLAQAAREIHTLVTVLPADEFFSRLVGSASIAG